MSDKKLYRQYPPETVESDAVFRHKMAMTGESLDSKAEIAAELAHRDIIIQDLTAQVEKLKTFADELQCEYDMLLNDRDRLEGENERLRALEALLTFVKNAFVKKPKI